VILSSLVAPVDEIEQGTGWALKPEGACRGSVCVPLPSPGGGALDVTVLADRLRMALVADERHGLWALGPAAAGPTVGSGLDTAEAPDFVLPDLAGQPFELRSLRGRKVVLVAWAPW
jgi:hypothetical protein